MLAQPFIRMDAYGHGGEGSRPSLCHRHIRVRR